jgi:osmoprotectant transport system ATP-binding protein
MAAIGQASREAGAGGALRGRPPTPGTCGQCAPDRMDYLMKDRPRQPLYGRSNLPRRCKCHVNRALSIEVNLVDAKQPDGPAGLAQKPRLKRAEAAGYPAPPLFDSDRSDLGDFHAGSRDATMFRRCHPAMMVALGTPGMIELKGVSKSYAGSMILPKLDLAIAPGRTTVLIGPSGCGKSTLLRLMIGLVWPDTGSVWIEGTELTPATVLEVRRRFGYVIQDGGLFPHLTARDNITVLADYLGWGRDRIRDRLAVLAELTRFPDTGLDRFPAQLSGGQRQRVSLMRALMLDPDVILLDEPLAALDPMVRAELQFDLRSIFRSLEKTVVMVTHDLAEAGWFGQEILLLRDGRIVQRGTLGELVNHPAEPFVTQFVSAQKQVLSIAIGGRS